MHLQFKDGVCGRESQIWKKIHWSSTTSVLS